MATHRLHDERRERHLGWDNQHRPVLHVDPGAEVEFSLADCFDGQLGAQASADDVGGLDLARANPLTGPVHVDGARPGDTLVIELLDVDTGPVGWTTIIPGFGLLADDFPDPFVLVSHRNGHDLDVGGLTTLPLEPFVGTIGLMPAAPGLHEVIPPRRVGGNLDCRDMRPGSIVRLPVEVEGGGLSLGDAHARQGDGEVCGTAVEVAAMVRVRIGVESGGAPDAPWLELAPEVRRVPDRTSGQRVLTTGVGPDLYAGARDATREMIERLVAETRCSPEQAYALCSIAGDLRIIEVVDRPNWVVGMEFDLGVM